MKSTFKIKITKNTSSATVDGNVKEIVTELSTLLVQNNELLKIVSVAANIAQRVSGQLANNDEE